MKIGIVTFHNADNYGATLQAYALQTVLCQAGHEALLVDYTSDYLKKPFGVENFRKKGVFGEMLTLAGEITRLPRKKPFRDFRKKHYSLTRELSKGELPLLNDEFDLFITGSDQVWNYKISNSDGAYFLDFVTDTAKKGSYAASFGFSSLPEDTTDWYREKLKDFRFLNIREPSGAQILRDLLGVESKVVLDPTLLLTKEDWAAVAVPPPVKGDYILTYQVGMDKNLLNYAKKLGEQLKCPVYSIPFPQGGLIPTHLVMTAGPKEWLGWIQNARCIVTDSFHGLALSLAFEKEFMVCYSARGRVLKSRQEDLMNALGIAGHTLTEDMTHAPEILDYNQIRPNMERLRMESMKALMDMVEGK